MKPFTRVLSAFAVGILLQGGVYLYLDQYMFAPTTEFNVSGASKDDTKNFPDVKEGRKYVSYDHQWACIRITRLLWPDSMQMIRNTK